MTDYSNFTEKDFQTSFQKIYEELTSDVAPTNGQPKAYLLGGQSGAGKSTIHAILKRNEHNLIVIDGDRFRERHPNFERIEQMYGQNAANYTQPFVNKMVTTLIDKLSSERYGLIIEGTCRSYNVPLRTCNELKQKGYHVELAFMCADKGIAWQSTIDRYNAMKDMGLVPRAVPQEKYNETVKMLPENVSRLYKARVFDDIRLFDRSGTCIYTCSKHPDKDPGKIVEFKLNEFSRTEIKEQKKDLPMHQKHRR